MSQGSASIRSKSVNKVKEEHDDKSSGPSPAALPEFQAVQEPVPQERANLFTSVKEDIVGEVTSAADESCEKAHKAKQDYHDELVARQECAKKMRQEREAQKMRAANTAVPQDGVHDDRTSRVDPPQTGTTEVIRPANHETGVPPTSPVEFHEGNSSS